MPRHRLTDEPEGAVRARALSVVSASDPAAAARLCERLDASVVEIRRLEVSLVANAYELATRLREVFDSQSWKARGRYRSFRAWCEAETSVSARLAREWIAAAKRFGEEKFRALGVRKLVALARAPVEDLPRLEAGAATQSTREVERSVQVARRDKGMRIRETPAAKNERLAKAAEASAKADPRISLALKVDARAQVVPLFADSTFKVQAAKLAPGLRAFLDLGGGVYATIELLEPASVRVQFGRKVEPAGKGAAK